jgi:hypothetical protein
LSGGRAFVLCFQAIQRLAAVTLWVRSYWVNDAWIFFDGGDTRRGTELYVE